MNAGKSTALLQSSYNYNERGMDTLLFTTKSDRRFDEIKIASRIGLESDATPFDDHFDFYSFITKALQKNKNIKCVLVDEAQFLTKSQVLDLANITDDFNVPVLAYGIRTDFRGEPFEGSQYLLSLSDIIIELKTICHCGKKATMNIRIDGNGNAVHEGIQIEIGGNERYAAVCRKHFREGQVRKE